MVISRSYPSHLDKFHEKRQMDLTPFFLSFLLKKKQLFLQSHLFSIFKTEATFSFASFFVHIFFIYFKKRNFKKMQLYFTGYLLAYPPTYPSGSLMLPNLTI